jgi:hypothetical protein
MPVRAVHGDEVAVSVEDEKAGVVENHPSVIALDMGLSSRRRRGRSRPSARSRL